MKIYFYIIIAIIIYFYIFKYNIYILERNHHIYFWGVIGCILLLCYLIKYHKYHIYYHETYIIYTSNINEPEAIDVLKVTCCEIDYTQNQILKIYILYKL